jgi:hypothetical protein
MVINWGNLIKATFTLRILLIELLWCPTWFVTQYGVICVNTVLPTYTNRCYCRLYSRFAAKIHNRGCSLTQAKLHDSLSLHPNKLHKIFIKYINIPTSAFWCYGGNCIVQCSQTCFGHSCGHIQGGENENADTIVMCPNHSTQSLVEIHGWAKQYNRDEHKVSEVENWCLEFVERRT